METRAKDSRREAGLAAGLVFREDEVVMFDFAFFFTGRAVPFLTKFFLALGGGLEDGGFLADVGERD